MPKKSPSSKQTESPANAAKGASKQPVKRAGKCAIVGRPNVGKSTLLNQVIGHSLAIATKTPQTTRNRILGVTVVDEPERTQIAFVDTPGLHKPKTALGRALIEEAKAALEDVDVIVFVTDVRATPDIDVFALEHLRARKIPILLAINKVDSLKTKVRLFELLTSYSDTKLFDALIPISAKTGDQVDKLLKEIASRMPEGALFDEEFLTDRPERFFASEIIREAAMSHLRDELPHGLAVVIDDWAETSRPVSQGSKERTPITRVTASIIVERESHKKMVIGARGGMSKAIGTSARIGLERMLGRKVFLEIWVRVEEDWTDDDRQVRSLVLDAQPAAYERPHVDARRGSRAAPSPETRRGSR